MKAQVPAMHNIFYPLHTCKQRKHFRGKINKMMFLIFSCKQISRFSIIRRKIRIIGKVFCVFLLIFPKRISKAFFELFRYENFIEHCQNSFKLRNGRREHFRDFFFFKCLFTYEFSISFVVKRTRIHLATVNFHRNSDDSPARFFFCVEQSKFSSGIIWRNKLSKAAVKSKRKWNKTRIKTSFSFLFIEKVVANAMQNFLLPQIFAEKKERRSKANSRQTWHDINTLVVASTLSRRRCCWL